MEFSVKSGYPQKQRTACIVAAVFEARKLSSTAKQLDEASNSYISDLLRRGDLEGKVGQMLLLHNVPGTLADRILLVGCGKERELTEQHFASIIRQVVSALNETGALEAVCCLTEEHLKNRDPYWRVRMAVEATEEAIYTFDQFKNKKEPRRRPLRKLVFTVPNRRELPSAERALAEGLAIGQATSFVKTLAHLPANICTPTYLANQAEKLAKHSEKISVAVLDKGQIQALNMGSFLSVAQGSEQAPKLITLEYRGTPKDTKPIVLVGKGITFDTGGNSLKTPTSMIGMKYDMCGAAAVLGVIKAASSLELPLNLVGVIPSCENMVSGRATRPGDIVTSLSGTHIEILNTDAEGRLILCDALTYAERYDPEVVIDIATLTGACINALGRHTTGLLTNHQPLANDLLQAGLEAQDKAWQLPLWDEYGEQLKSSVADLSNVGIPGEAGTIVAGCFLAHFAKKFHWAHLDIAGTATRASGANKGATGRPVPLLVQYLLNCIPNKKTKHE